MVVEVDEVRDVLRAKLLRQINFRNHEVTAVIVAALIFWDKKY